MIVDPLKLTIVPDSELNLMMKPTKIDDDDYFEQHKSTIIWHSKRLGISTEEVVQQWKQAPEQKFAWGQFKEYLLKYHKPGKRKSMFSAPIPVGYNILGYDLPIVNRLSTLYGDTTSRGETNIFQPRDKYDVMFMAGLWTENLGDNGPDSLTMDNIRAWLGIDSTNAHDALQDVKDTAELFIRFMKLHRRYAKKVEWKWNH